MKIETELESFNNKTNDLMIHSYNQASCIMVLKLLLKVYTGFIVIGVTRGDSMWVSGVWDKVGAD